MTSPGSGPHIRLEDEPALGFDITRPRPDPDMPQSPGSGPHIRLEDEPALTFTATSPNASSPAGERTTSNTASPAAADPDDGEIPRNPGRRDVLANTGRVIADLLLER